MTKERLIWIDALKGWLMILVVIGHALQTELGEACENSHLWNLIYSFHMPAFMAVSGWLFYQPYLSTKSVGQSHRRSYIEICIRRINQLIIPYLIWSLLVFLLRGQYTTDCLLNIVYMPDNYFWFLWVLFGIAVIFSGIQNLSYRIKINDIVLIVCFGLILLGIMVSVELRVFGFQFLAYYFIFYTIGYCLHKYESRLSKLRNPIILFILFGIWIFLAWGWKMHNVPSWMPHIQHIPFSILQYAYRGVTAFLAVVILLITAPYIMNGTNKINRMICIIGNVSLGIYVCHMAIIGYMKDGIHKLPINNPYVNVTMIFTVTFIFSFLLVMLLRKNKYTAKLLLGKV